MNNARRLLLTSLWTLDMQANDMVRHAEKIGKKKRCKRNPKAKDKKPKTFGKNKRRK